MSELDNAGRPTPPPQPSRNGVIFAALYLVFTWGFILCPYWRYPLPNESQTPALRQTVFVTIGILAALVWAFLASPLRRSSPSLTIEISSSQKRRRLIVHHLVPITLLLAFLLALNFRSLTLGIPWRGDEDQHMRNTVMLVEQLSSHACMPWTLGIPIAAAGFMVLAWRRPQLRRLYLPACLVMAALEILWIVSRNPLAMLSLTRYPVLPRWYSALLPLLLSPFLHLQRPFTGHYAEAVYRAVPFLCAVGLGGLVFVHLAWRRDRIVTIISAIFALAIGTLPLVVYYSSLLYLEMPAVLLITVALLSGRRLLAADAERLRRLPAWYALILIGFVKETTLPFLAAFVLLRGVVQLRRWMKSRPVSFWRWVAQELAIVICAILPLALYLVFRKFFPEKRSMTPALEHLWDLENYRTLFQSYVQQFAILLPLALAGLVMMFRRGRFAWAAFCLLALGMDAGLHLIDDDRFIGYSRFNLFALPPLITLAVYLMRHLLRSGRMLQAASLIAIGCIVCNSWMWPLNSDGTRRSTEASLTWGDWRFDTSEHDYPFREALQFLQKQKVRQILPANLSYPYHVDFYVDPHMKLLARPRLTAGKQEAFDDTLALANQTGCDAVIFQLVGNLMPGLNESYGYSAQLFEKNGYKLVVFYKQQQSGR